MSPELKAKVEQRAESLYPHVSSFSNYIVQLIKMDMERGLIGPALKGKEIPFDRPLAPFISNALV